MSELGGILDRLEARLGGRSGEPRPLHGGITNRNYRVTLGGSEYVVRLPGAGTHLLGIDRESERLASEAASGMGIAPEVVTTLGACLVTRFVPCRTASSEEVREAASQLGRALLRFHSSTVSLPATFHVGRLLEDYASVVRDRGAALPEEYAELLELARNIELALPPAPSAPCHNDLLAANVIRALEDERLLIVDWEYAGMGDPRFDLGNLCVNNDFDEHAEEQLLRSYLARAPTDAERAALRLMRLLSDAREAAWGIVQSAISELEFDFERYAREHMGRLQETLANAPLSQWLTTAHG